MNFKVGVVSEAKPGFAKVSFDQDGIDTDWLPIIVPYSLKDKVGYVLNVNEHVACMGTARFEEGVILGAIHSNPDPADTDATANTFRQVYEDSALFSYDKSQHKFNMQGHDGKKLSDIFSNIIAAVQQITVIYGNNPDYTKLSQAQTILESLLE